MATYDNAPPLDGWACEARTCPFPDCWLCERPQPDEPHLIRGTE